MATSSRRFAPSAPTLSLIACLIAGTALSGTTYTWNDNGNDWFDGNNWDGGAGYPVAGDDAIVPSGSVLLTNTTEALASFTLSGGTLTFTNWTTKLVAANVSIAGGTVTHVINSATTTNAAGEWPTHGRVHFDCTDFMLEGGTINVIYRGFQGRPATGTGTGYGPGAGTGHGGGGYGGKGGRDEGGEPYGSLTAPEHPGSAGGCGNSVTGGAGGGAVRIEASGTVTINGTIDAYGRDMGTSGYGGCGSGGSIYISCSEFAGTNGVLNANGGHGGKTYVGGGSGGRIAVVYDPAVQSNLPLPGVTFSTTPGTLVVDGDIGTLYFPDNQFLTNVLTHSGEWHVGTPFTSWSPTGLTVNSGWIRFPQTGLVVNVTGDILVQGSDRERHKLAFMSAQVGCSGDITANKADLKFRTDAASVPRLTCSGSVTITNGAYLYVYSGATNGATDYGSLFAVTGNLTVASGCYIWPYSQNTNGGSPSFVVSNFTLLAGGYVNADGKGFKGGVYESAVAWGYGPGRGYGGAGGSYGGLGGKYTATYYSLGTYGSPSHPIDAGSGGGSQSVGRLGGGGGGVIRIRANDRITVDGILSANGGKSASYAGGGSGGGIYLEGTTIEGSGSITALGGDAGDYRYGHGAGGRIALVYDTTAQKSIAVPSFTCSAAPLDRSTSQLYGDLGTLYLSDTRFLSGSVSHSGSIVVPGLAHLAMDTFTVNGGWLRFTQDGLQVTVSNDVVVSGAAAALEFIGGLTYRDGYPGDYYSDSCGTQDVVVAGNLVVTNGAWFSVASGATNGAASGYGARVAVTGTLTVADTSSVLLKCSPTNGGSVFVEAGNVNVLSGGQINAAAQGFAAVSSSATTPLGPGTPASSAYYYSGAGHGGVGHTYSSNPGGPTYGSSNTPVLPGSSSRSNRDLGGAGGGLVRIESPGTVSVEGSISANGGAGIYRTYAGGSGGAIYIRCRTLTGSAGNISANGGAGGTSNPERGGGGGRIAVWRAYSTYAGATNVLPSGGYAGSSAQTGTIVFVNTGPSIDNVRATNVLANTASLVGELTGTGIAPALVTCYWGESDGQNVKSNWDTNTPLGGLGIGMITNHVTGLTKGTHYYFRFYATNAYGDNWGEPFGDFSTLGGLSVENEAPTDITTTETTLRGNVTAGNPTPTAYFCWGDNDAGRTDTSLWDQVVGIGSTLGPYSNRVSGLLANKTYHYCAYITNSSGPGWAPAVTNFTTISPTMWIDDPAPIAEGNSGSQGLAFTVTISATSDVPVTVGFATANGWAEAPADYTASNGTLTIPAGQLTGTITVPIQGDTADEHPYQDFFVNLSAPGYATLTDAQGHGIITDDDDEQQTKTWTGTGQWFSFTNWNPTGWPGPADAVVIASGQVTLSNSATVASVIVSNGASLVFTNWSTRLTAASVSIHGTVTLPPPFVEGVMSNRVWFACTEFAVDSSGLIDANAKGFYGERGEISFAPGHGPGKGLAGSNFGAGHGGFGGTDGGGGLTYGSASAPLAPGSSGGIGNAGSNAGHGGGAVRIDASGQVTVDGTITANGGDAYRYGAGGSGGSIYVTCDTFHGSNGILTANGGNITDSRFGRGGGGRISVAYNPVAQSNEVAPTVTFAVTSYGRNMYHVYGDIGTLYFPDAQFLTETLRHSGQIVIPGFTRWSVGQLTLDNAYVRFAADGFALSVGGDLVINGSGAQLDIGGNARLLDKPGFYYSDMTHAPRLTIGGDLILTNAGNLYVGSTATNTSVPDNGAHVGVAGQIHLSPSSWVYLSSHPTNGGSPLVEATDLHIASDAGISASGYGFMSPNVVGGFLGGGPGAGSYRGGGGFGGAGSDGGPGGTGGPTYGSSNAPVLPGSSGGEQAGEDEIGGRGGGAIRISVEGAIVIETNGTIVAEGNMSPSSHRGSGSGGAIYLTCRSIAGLGTLSAAGSNGNTVYSGAGGGGRIAVWFSKDLTGGLMPTIVTGGTDDYRTAASGTVVWGQIPPTSFIFLIR